MRGFTFACVFLATQVASVAFAQEKVSQASGAVLRGLDKFSGESLDIPLLTGQVTRFGRLNITLLECRFPEGNPTGNAYAALEVNEVGREGIVFSGWMVASAPALSAMDHARYDIWVIRCTTN